MDVTFCDSAERSCFLLLWYFDTDFVVVSSPEDNVIMIICIDFCFSAGVLV